MQTKRIWLSNGKIIVPFFSTIQSSSNLSLPFQYTIMYSVQKLPVHNHKCSLSQFPGGYLPVFNSPGNQTTMIKVYVGALFFSSLSLSGRLFPSFSLSLSLPLYLLYLSPSLSLFLLSLSLLHLGKLLGITQRHSLRTKLMYRTEAACFSVSEGYNRDSPFTFT